MTTIFDIPGSNPPNPFSTPIQALLTTTNLSSAPDETAAQLVNFVNTCSDPANALWKLWDAFFTAVVTSTSHLPHLALLGALRSQPPTQPSNVRPGSDAQRQLRSYIGADGKLRWKTLPRFSAQWRDVHDILEAWRGWDGVRDSDAEDGSTATAFNSSGGAEYFLRFCNFSAAQLKATNGRGEVHPVSVFYACRDVLEREPLGPQSHHPQAHRIPPVQVWTLDVRVAATWMRDGALTLWEADHEELRRHWATALGDKTALWPREDGLTRERWHLWERRLRDLSAEGETRAVVAEAAEVVSGLMGENFKTEAGRTVKGRRRKAYDVDAHSCP